MKCFRRSTRSFASSGLLLLLWTAPLYGGFSTPLEASRAQADVSADAVTRAIETAVYARIGRDVTVMVQDLSGVRLATASSSIVAVADPSARIGGPVRFVLADSAPGRPRTRLGEATATVQITAKAVRARRAIARGARLDAEDISLLETDLIGRPMRPLLSLEDVLGARATQDIVEDALVTRADIVPEPVVKAGEIVRAHVRVGDVELSGSVIAAENGMKDDVIRVVNQGSRHAFRARVIGSGEVEVVYVR